MVSTRTRAERLVLVDREATELPLASQCEWLSLNRTSLYYTPVAPSPEEVALKHRIDELYTAFPFYGSRKLAALLGVNRKAVQRHMQEMGIAAICPGPNLSRRNIAHRVFPYLLRGLEVTHPNHVWGIDITYIRLRHGWLYLVAILDWYSRYVISWALDQTLAIDFVLEVVGQALAVAKPTICNSDQGSHFTSPQYTQLLTQAEVLVSMDGKNRALDNVFTERLWRSVKYENVYLNDYATPREARLGLAEYFDFYNHQRPHQSLAYRPPASVYFSREAV